MAKGQFKYRVQQKYPKAKAVWVSASESEEWGWRIKDMNSGLFLSDGHEAPFHAWSQAWFRSGGTR